MGCNPKLIWSIVALTLTLEPLTFFTFPSTYLPPATKLRQGNVFTPVCHSVHRGECLHLVRGTCPLGRHPPGQTPSRADGRHPPSLGRHPPAQCMLGYTHLPTQCMLGYGQQVGSAHPTGMHSCLQKVQLVFDYWNHLHFYFSKYILFKKFNLYMLK